MKTTLHLLITLHDGTPHEHAAFTADHIKNTLEQNPSYHVLSPSEGFTINIEEVKERDVLPYALGPYLCPECKTCLSPKEFGHTMCRKCAEKDMAKRLGGGLLNLPDDWYDNTPDRGPQ